ncbi:MAG: PhnD/SsuA/transferrin family substrate-binding protein [Pseudomonadota bacterium]|nr:PhnD/SsuA/transferrin family substrate-binding protein [Pseudomonadota bacterium]
MPHPRTMAKTIASAGTALLVLCGLLWTLLLSNNAYSETITIYHFNPETHSDRNLVLKNTFDLYFQTRHNIQLQPVEDHHSFVDIVRKIHRSLFIMSDWHYHQLAQEQPDLVPVLQGTKDGKNTFRKLLIGKQPFPSNQITVAVSGTKDYVDMILNNMSFNGITLKPGSYRLLKVPKDIDALLAVSFGMADAALASDDSFEKLSQLYRNEYQQLDLLGTSQPQQRLVVVLLRSQTEQLQPALEALETMDQSQQGKLGLNLLGLDEWTPIKTTRKKGGQP